MRVSIKAKQIAGVTVIVGVAVVALSGLYVTRLAGVVLNEAHARGQLLSNAILHRAREVVPESPDVRAALATDSGLRSILEASIYGESITDAAIVDTANVVIASSDTIRVDSEQRPRADLAALLGESRFAQLSAIYAGEGQTLDIRQPITLGTEAFGSIVIGVSTLLMRQELDALLRPALITAGVSLVVAVIVAALLSQLLLRPIHVIRSGLTRLGQGEFGVTLDLPPGDEFGDLGEYFNAVSRQLHADRGAAQAPVDPKRLLESTLAYSRKLVALNRLTAGIAHEVKNPLNAMMIHLELLRTKIRRGALAPVGASPGLGPRPVRPGHAPARRNHRRGDPAPRRGGAGLPEVHAAGRAQAAAGEHRGALPGDPAHRRAGGADAQRQGRGGRAAVAAGGQRRRGHAAAGVPQPGDQRLPGDAERRDAPAGGGAGDARHARGAHRGHRRRDSARAPRKNL
jgi:hypothetical protein